MAVCYPFKNGRPRTEKSDFAKTGQELSFGGF
jgi:hypothetical protein